MNALGITTFVVLTTAAVAGYVSVGNTYWTSFGSTHTGLFQFCISGTCYFVDHAQDWLNATRAFFIIGVICLGLNQIVMPFHIFQGWSKCPLSKNSMQLITMVLAAVAGVSQVIAVAIYGGKMKEDFGWTFGLAAATPVLALIGAALAFLTRKQSLYYT